MNEIYFLNYLMHKKMTLFLEGHFIKKSLFMGD